MDADYRRLCIEIFGTDDVDQIRKLAGKQNARNAGRKRKFSDKDIADMRKLRARGVSMNKIAEQYHTSRQVVDKYLNTKPAQGYTMRITYMNKHTPCTEIDVDFLNRNVRIQNYTDDILHRAFGITETPTWTDFEDFLQYRCFPATRGNAKDILRDLQIQAYDTLQIVEKTHGRITDDNMWLKIRYYNHENI